MLTCQHPCQQKCSDPCTVTKNCVHCHAKQQAADQLKLQAIRAQITRLQQMATANQFRLQPITTVGDDSADFHHVMDAVQNSTKADHGKLQVVAVERIHNPALQAKCLAMAVNLEQPTPRLLFHGTDANSTMLIAQNGFKLPDQKPSNMFGQGVYFAIDSSKSAQEIYTKGSLRLLLCEVYLGKTCTIKGLAKAPGPLRPHIKQTNNRSHLDVNEAIMNSLGYHSVFAERGTRKDAGVKFDEYIVYNVYQAFPAYIVHFQRV